MVTQPSSESSLETAPQRRRLERRGQAQRRKSRRRTVFITGAAGFIGSHLVAACLGRGWRVLAVDALTPWYSPEQKRSNISSLEGVQDWRFVEGNLLELDLPELMEGVDIVFHLAAHPGVHASWGDRFDVYLDDNVRAVQHLLEALKASSVSRCVFASSSSVYGNSEHLPTAEDAPLQPVSPYGATKVLGEHLAQMYWRSYGVPTVRLRYFTVYGPRQRPDMAFHRVFEAALSGTPVTVYGDGEQSRDFTYVDDAVAATLAAGVQGRPGAVYNIGGGRQVCLNDVIGAVEQLVGRRLEVQHSPAQPGDARHTKANTLRAYEGLDFVPRWTLGDGLAEQLAWHRSMNGHFGAAARALEPRLIEEGGRATPPSSSL